MKLALVVGFVVVVVAVLGYIKWRQERQSAEAQAWIAHAEKTSANLAALTERAQPDTRTVSC